MIYLEHDKEFRIGETVYVATVNARLRKGVILIREVVRPVDESLFVTLRRIRDLGGFQVHNLNKNVFHLDELELARKKCKEITEIFNRKWE